MSAPPDAIKPPETRWCVRCGVLKPLDREHFGGRSKSSKRASIEFTHHCLDCGKKAKHKPASPIQDGRDWS